MSVKLISFSADNGKKSVKQTETVKTKYNKLKNEINVSVPYNYEISINPKKQRVMIMPETDEFVANKETVKEQKTAAKKQIADTKEQITDKKESKPKKESKTSDKNSDDKALLEKVQKGTRIAVTIIMTALSALGIKEGNDILQQAQIPQSASVDFKAEDQKIEDIADLYGVDEDVIRYCNGIFSDDDVKDVDSLTIPMPYDYLDDVITAQTQDLYKADTKEQADISKELKALTKKQEEQKAVADMYSDETNVYIAIKDIEDNPELVKKFGGNYIPVDYIETLFDIKKGELYNYNSFWTGEDLKKQSFTLETDKEKALDNNTRYVYLGTIIKVPKSAIDTDNINLKAYKP